MDRVAADRLLAFVRAAIAHELGVGPPPEFLPGPAADPFGGVFVTLTRGDRLRGCMGTFHPEGTLLETLDSAARSAAHDPRFRNCPITSAEFLDLRIEISIVSPPVRIDRPDALQIGLHGIWIRRGAATGCFLPHVAVERHWSVEEFLSQCCSMKAGLPPDAWRDPQTEVHLFEAEVLGGWTGSA